MQLRGITMKRIVAAYVIYTNMTQAKRPSSKYRLILALMMISPYIRILLRITVDWNGRIHAAGIFASMQLSPYS